MRRILARLGDPWRSCRVIHVGGTNGKGSTLAFIDAIFRPTRLKVGLFTSPHIEDLSERFVLDGKPIDHDTLDFFAREVERAASIRPPLDLSYFEVTVAIAFRYFASVGVDLALIEVGLGGRLDSTNIVDPAVSVITGVGFDHTDRLGSTHEAIAREKGGIAKAGRPLIYRADSDAIERALKAMARSVGAVAHRYGDGFHASRKEIAAESERLDYHEGDRTIVEIKIPLIGREQVVNCALAIRAASEFARASGIDLSDETIRSALGSVELAGRYETREGIGSSPIIFDGAHNLPAAQALARTIEERFGLGAVDILFGAMRDKDYRAMLGAFERVSRRIYLVAAPIERAATAPELETAARAVGLAAEPVEGADRIMEILTGEDRATLLVTGSFTVIGMVREILREGGFPSARS